MKRTVSDLMKQKDLSHPPMIDESSTVLQALTSLESSDVGALLVMSHGSVIGVFSERDFARAFVANSKRFNLDCKVTSIMSHQVVYVTPDYRLDECLAVMLKMKVRHLPVLHGEVPVAFLSMRHIMEALIDENQFMVEQLITYITGSGVHSFTFHEPKATRSPLTKLHNASLEGNLV